MDVFRVTCFSVVSIKNSFNDLILLHEIRRIPTKYKRVNGRTGQLPIHHGKYIDDFLLALFIYIIFVALNFKVGFTNWTLNYIKNIPYFIHKLYVETTVKIAYSLGKTTIKNFV